jgi:uncharacterized protein YdhG (YjbR/CyaY superfamily)
MPRHRAIHREGDRQHERALSGPLPYCRGGRAADDRRVRGRLHGAARDLLDRLRALAQESVPGASEAIEWGSPAWVRPSGTILFMVSNYAKHAGIALTPSTRQVFDADLRRTGSE